MTSFQSTTIRAALILLWLCANVEAGGRLHHGPVCNGLDVPCAPKRPTYGYTPTTWRRWPNIQTSAVPTRAPEELPTPAKDARPSVEPDATIVAPEEAPLVPTEPDSTLPPPSAEPIAPPFEDTPPTPPTEAEPKQAPSTETPETPPADTAPAETAPTDVTPPLDNLFDPPSTEPAAEAAPGAEVGPPAMPAEDPFKDDPFKDDPAPSAPAEETPKGGTYEQRGAPALLGRSGATRWNSASHATEVAVAGPELKPYARIGEPRRLSESPRSADAPEVLPVSAAEKRNPLRATPLKTRARTVVPTASWSAEHSAAQVSSAARPNPLRPN